MKWKAELFIFNQDYGFTPKQPDAFVESESKLEACNIIMHYVLTMINKTDDFRIEVSKIKNKEVNQND